MILWNCEPSLYTVFECRDVIVKLFTGIVIDYSTTTQMFYHCNKPNLPDSICQLNGKPEDMLANFPEIKTYYSDEMYSTPPKGEVEGMLRGRQMLKDKGIALNLGEINKVPALNNNETLTYTSYQTYLFPLFGLRIYNPLSNQLGTWQKLDKLYGSKFPACWISLNKNINDYPELIKWAKDHNKTIMIFSDQGISKIDFLNRLKLLSEAIR